MENAWGKIREYLAASLAEAQYKVWISPLKAKLEGDTLTVFTLNDFVAKFVRNRFQQAILQAAAQVLQCEVRLHICADPASSENGGLPAATAECTAACPLPVHTAQTQVIGPQTVSAQAAESAVQPNQDEAAVTRQAILPLRWPEGQGARLARSWRHTFEDFVVGPCNELAHAAARGICRNEGCRFGAGDMLFLCSPPGLGKTHLMQAVGASLIRASNLHTPKVEYLTAEEFANQMRFSLRNGDIDRFKARYRQSDVLLLEDIHFLQDKEKTQNEVLATLAALMERGSRVVLASSFALPELRKLDSQLFSRLSSGLIAAIDRPDKETRKRIISRKASAGQIRLTEDVTDYLAENISSDVRQIESCLRNLALKASLLNHCINLDMAREAVANYLGCSNSLSLSGIVRLVCEGFGISAETLNSKSRKQEHVQARNAAFYLARKHTELSLQEIGKRFNRTHSTVIKGITSLEREISRQTVAGRQLANAISSIERNGGVAGRPG